MVLKKGDIVNVRYQGKFWKGRIESLSAGLNERIQYCEPIAYIHEIQGIGISVVMESDLEFKNGEWWER